MILGGGRSLTDHTHLIHHTLPSPILLFQCYKKEWISCLYVMDMCILFLDLISIDSFLYCFRETSYPGEFTLRNYFTSKIQNNSCLLEIPENSKTFIPSYQATPAIIIIIIIDSQF